MIFTHEADHFENLRGDESSLLWSETKIAVGNNFERLPSRQVEILMAAAVALLSSGQQTVLYRIKENREGETQSTCIAIVQVINNLAIFTCHPKGVRTIKVKVPLRPHEYFLCASRTS